MIEWLRHPAGQIVLIALVEAGVLLWLYQWRGKPAFIAAIAVPVVGAAVVVIGLVYVSPRDRVNRAIDEIRRAIIAGDADAVMEHIDPTYDFYGFTYDQLARWLRIRLDHVRISNVRITGREFTSVSDRRITVRLDVVSSAERGYAGTVRSSWQLTFRPLDDRWLLSEIDPIALDGHQFDGLRDLP